jgi:hypothetical protein
MPASQDDPVPAPQIIAGFLRPMTPVKAAITAKTGVAERPSQQAADLAREAPLLVSPAG